MPTQTQVLPPWMRLPAAKPGARCPLTGLSRSTILRLCDDGKVRSKTMREPGKRRGAFLVNVQSLLDYINALPEGCSNE